MRYWLKCYVVCKWVSYDHLYEFPSEEGVICLFVSNETLWLKYKICPLKSCFSAICFDAGIVYLDGMLCNCCVIP